MLRYIMVDIRRPPRLEDLGPLLSRTGAVTGWRRGGCRTSWRASRRIQVEWFRAMGGSAGLKGDTACKATTVGAGGLLSEVMSGKLRALTLIAQLLGRPYMASLVCQNLSAGDQLGPIPAFGPFSLSPR